MVVGMASSGGSAPRTPPAVMVLAGDPPQRDESAQESPVWRLDGGVMARQFTRDMALFIGVFAPNRRRQKS
jgi:hypothetical protein